MVAVPVLDRAVERADPLGGRGPRGPARAGEVDVDVASARGARRVLVLLALAEAAGGLCEERRPAAELGGVRREAVTGVRADVEEKRELVPAGVGVLAVREVLDLQAADGRAARVGEVIEVVGV